MRSTSARVRIRTCAPILSVPPPLRARWYPGTARRARRATSTLPRRRRPDGDPARAGSTRVIAPHAGLMFSGPVGAYAYKAAAARGPFDAVVLVGPSHFVAFDGVALYPSGAFESPLGPAPIDEALGARAAGGVPADPRAARRARGASTRSRCSCRSSGGCSRTRRSCRCSWASRRARRSRRWRRRSRQVGAGAAPAARRQHRSVALLRREHRAAARRARRRTAWRRSTRSGCWTSSSSTRKWSADAMSPAAAAPPSPSCWRRGRAGRRDARVLKYMHSGDISGDNSGVVGYLRRRVRDASPMFTDDAAARARRDRARARSRTRWPAVESRGAVPRGPARGQRRVRHAQDGRHSSAAASAPSSAGVRSRRRWRECAVCAAREDPRFEPVRRQSSTRLDVEVSVLGPLERDRSVAIPDAIVIGVHGLVVERGTRRGLLLPQVATEWGWTASSSWRTPARRRACRPMPGGTARRVYRFAAEVFGD